MILADVASGVPLPPNAQIAMILAFGATPRSRVCEPIAPAMPVPCASGGASAAPGVIAIDDRPAISGCLGSTREIDQRDDDVFAFGDAVHSAELQFFHDVLRWIAEIGDGVALILRQAIGVVRLRRGVQSGGLDGADDLAHRSARC